MNSFGSHIIGGDITYTFLSYNQDRTEINYEVQLALYRDPTGVNYDAFASFGVFKQNAQGGWDSYKVVPMVLTTEIFEYNPLGDPCKTRYLSEDKLEYTYYTFNLTLEVTDQNYMIAYQKGYRNYTINNVIGGGDIGAVYDVIITPESMEIGNSSPKFGPIPPLFVCAGYDLDIDHSAADQDGDRLEYRFCTPLFPGLDDGTSTDLNCCGCTNPDPVICNPPYPELTYVEGFSPQNPMRGNPQVSINSETGKITGKPELLGPYVVVVCVDEYRGNTKIGTVRRDFELNSIICSDYLRAEVESDTYYTHPQTGKTVAYFESCNDTRFSVNNLSVDEQYIRDYIWEVYDEDDNLVYERSGLQNRDITLNLPARGRYFGQMILNDNEACYDTAFMEFLVAPEAILDFSYDFNKCDVGPVRFRNLTINDESIVDWNWDFGDGNTSVNQNPSHTYDSEGTYQVELLVTDENGCEDSFIENVRYVLFEDESITVERSICDGDTFEFGDQMYSEAGAYDFKFMDENGCDSVVTLDLVVLPTHFMEFVDTICTGEEYPFIDKFLTETGVYRDTLVNSFGCDSIIVLDLHVGQSAVVVLFDSDFDKCSPGPVTFNNLSADADNVVKWLWDFGDGTFSNETAPSKIYSDEGSYQVNLEAVDIYGCQFSLSDGLTYEYFEHQAISVNREICEEESFMFGDQNYSESGIYEYTFIDKNECDSTVTLNLEVLQNSYFEYEDSICLGDEYFFQERGLIAEGVFSDTLVNAVGCDSVVVVNLYVGQNLTRIDLDEPLVTSYGSTITLSPSVQGGNLIYKQWSNEDQVLSNALVLNYLVQKDEWLFFESANEMFCLAQDSAFVRSTVEKGLYVPNIFSPNDDGVNDLFFVGSTKSLRLLEMKIFDRWGNHVYGTDDITKSLAANSWDGNFNGRPAEIGVYVYTIEFEFVNGDRGLQKGTVQLIR